MSDRMAPQSKTHQAMALTVLVVAAAALGVAAIAWPALQADGFPLDDSWIHQVIGRNAGLTGQPGFIPGMATAGSTSAIWPWIIAVKYRVLPLADPVHYLLALNAILFLVIVLALLRAARRDSLPLSHLVLFAVVPAITGNVAWLIATGMEHLLFIAAIVLAAGCWLSGKPGGDLASAALAGVFCGLTIVARPEGAFFLPLFLIQGYLKRRPARDVAALLAPVAVALAFLTMTNLWTSHAVMPVTFGGRRWLYFGAHPANPILLALRFVGVILDHIVRYGVGVSLGKFGNYGLGGLLVLVMALGVHDLYRRRAEAMLFLIGLAVINVLSYLVLMPNIGQGMRYQALILLFVMPLIAAGVSSILAWVGARGALTPGALRNLGLAVVVAALGLSGVTLWRWSHITAIGVAHINDTHVRMGRWLQAHLPPGAAVASFDIGGIGYFSGHRIVDLGGLTDPSFVPVLQSGTIGPYLRSRHIQWLVLPMSVVGGDCTGLEQRLSLCASDGVAKRAIVAFASPAQPWALGFAATGHAEQSQVLYRLGPG